MTIINEELAKSTRAIRKWVVFAALVFIPMIFFSDYFYDKNIHPLYFVAGGGIVGIIMGRYIAHAYHHFLQLSETKRYDKEMKSSIRLFYTNTIIYSICITIGYLLTHDVLSITGWSYFIFANFTIATKLYFIKKMKKNDISINQEELDDRK